MSVLNQVKDDYVIRRYEEGDLSGFLSLDRAVFRRHRDEGWFRWKYVDNPYVDDIPVFVVEKDGEIVGARPFLAFRMRAGSKTVLALQPADTMVHPDHRRKGLFTRMTRHAVDHYYDGEPAFCFNFPNQRSRPGYLKLGWQIVGDRETYYRIRNPSALLDGDDQFGTRFLDLVMPLTNDVHGMYRSSTTVPESYSITRYSGVEQGTLTELYRKNPPDGIHARRDETFFRWRFASPAWERTTYVASDFGDLVAGIVVRKRTTSDGVAVVQLAEVVPLVGDESRKHALVCLLDRIVRDYDASDLISVTDGAIPPAVLARFGFVGDARPPLSWLSDFDCRLVAFPLDSDGWTVGGTRLCQRSNWHLSFAERDTA
jgi:GNAT superfamily N-acetyltransferase